MRRPKQAGSPVNIQRTREWIKRFGAYRAAVTEQAIQDWLGQFNNKDKDTAARLLDVVEFYGNSQIHNAFRETLDALPGWSVDENARSGQWLFAAMSGSAGESGDNMLYHFRLANGLDKRKFDKLFVSRSSIVSHKLGENDTIVLLDDFSGTGTQVCSAWNDPDVAFGELLAEVGNVYLVLVAATKGAIDRIGAETSLKVFPSYRLDDKDNIFSNSCSTFSPQDKDIILRYCRKANAKDPRGYGDCGLVVVFQHRTPNNSLPILHADHDNWAGLFPRHE